MLKSDLASFLIYQAGNTLDVARQQMPSVSSLANSSDSQQRQMRAVTLLHSLTESLQDTRLSSELSALMSSLKTATGSSSEQKGARALEAALQDDDKSKSSPHSTLRSLSLLDRSVASMEMLVMNMLDYQNLKDGHHMTQYSVVDCRELLTMLRDSQRAQWRAKSQQVAVEVDPAVPLIYVESQLLSKSLSVLFDNALEHTRSGTRVLLSCRLVAAVLPPLDSGGHDDSSRTTSADSSSSNLASPLTSPASSVVLARTKSAVFSSMLWTSERGDATPVLAALTVTEERTSAMMKLAAEPPREMEAVAGGVLNRKVETSSAFDQCELEFRVCDNGEGLSTTVLSELEKGTFQVNATTTRSTSGGLGLGFKIAALCAQHLDGTLELVSSPLPAEPASTVASMWRTQFVLSVWVDTADAFCRSQRTAQPSSSAGNNPATAATTGEAVAPATDLEAWSLFSSAEKQMALVNRLLSSEWEAQRLTMRILIVEDNLVNVKVLKQCLQKRDFCSLYVAANGQLAVEQARSNPFDLILMDLEMPVKDGITAASEITRDASNPNCRTPIVALTANATSEAQARCLDAGMCLYLTKPLNANSLMLCIAALTPFTFYPLAYCPYVLLYLPQITN